MRPPRFRLRTLLVAVAVARPELLALAVALGAPAALLVQSRRRPPTAVEVITVILIAIIAALVAMPAQSTRCHLAPITAPPPGAGRDPANLEVGDRIGASP